MGLPGHRRQALRRRAPLVLLVLLRSSHRLLHLLASLARRGRSARVRLPFPRPLEASAAPGVKEKVPERSRPDGIWRLASCDRLVSPERVRPPDSVQDGNSHFCTVICQRGGFSSFPGSEGLLLSDPNPSILTEAIEVSRRRGQFTSSEPRVSDCRPLPRSSPGSSQLCQRGHTLTGSDFYGIWATG